VFFLVTICVTIYLALAKGVAKVGMARAWFDSTYQVQEPVVQVMAAQATGRIGSRRRCREAAGCCLSPTLLYGNVFKNQLLCVNSPADGFDCKCAACLHASQIRGTDHDAAALLQR